MSAASDALVEFLRARLDEDERDATAASPSPWNTNTEHDEVLASDGITVAEGFALSGPQLRATVDHIVRHDPARVLRDVDAKRRIIDEHAHIPGDGINFTSAEQDRAERTLKLLALAYANHSDYQESWRP